ncbi:MULTISPECIES: hypothetical protein [Planktothrix]|uniref:hypothetical protein n=1 Tax=Planktothrix TaxID=54304 RepID=UPI0004243CE1|nr:MULTISPECIES: hypothetical protein [Planktothrix]
MKYIKLFQGIVLAVAMIGATTAGLIGRVMAQQVLESSKTLSGRIDSSSNPVAVPGKGYHPGVQYTFEAVAADNIQITAIREEGSTVDIILVVYPPNQSPIGPIDLDLAGGQQEVFGKNSASSGGTWKVSVVSYNDKPGNYYITLVIKRNNTVVIPQEKLPYADEVMKKLNLTSTACSTPDVVAVIDIRGEKRCTRGWDSGEWVYDESINQLAAKQPADPYIAMINSWGATRVDCNAGTALVKIAFEANKVYCIVPTSEVQAGNYAYDQASGEIVPLDAPPPPSNPSPDYTPTPVTNPQPTDDGRF